MTDRTLVIRRSPFGAKTHRLDPAYSVLQKAICGAKVSSDAVERPNHGSSDCRRCRELAGER